MLRYTSVNHNPIEFIKQVLVDSNIRNKICIDYITSTIDKIDIIRWIIANSNKKVI